LKKTYDHLIHTDKRALYGVRIFQLKVELAQHVCRLH